MCIEESYVRTADFFRYAKLSTSPKIEVGDIALDKKRRYIGESEYFFREKGRRFPLSQSEVGAEQWRPIHCDRPTFAALQREHGGGQPPLVKALVAGVRNNH